MTFLALVLAAQLVWTWAYRGGSSGFPIPYSRWASLLITPAIIAAALVAAPGDAGFYEYAALGLGVLLMFGAQADGWGNQMDLGSNDKPDTETGHKIRDLFFKAKSSFARDLVGLYMRMAQFIPATVAFYVFDPLSAIIPGFLVVGAPLVWVAEHVLIKGTRLQSVTLPWEKGSPVAWVEWAIGVILAILTTVVILA